MLPSVSLPLTCAAVANIVFLAILPSAFIVATGHLVGAVPRAIGTGAHGAATPVLYQWLVITVALYGFQQLVLPIVAVATAVLGQRLDHRIAQRIMFLVSRPTTITHIEDPATLDAVRDASGLTTGHSAGDALVNAIQLWGMRLSALASAALIAQFHWWLAIILIAVPVAQMRYWRELGKSTAATMFNQGQHLRKSAYVRDLALTPRGGAEIRVFGLSRHLVDRCHRVWDAAMTPVWREWRQGEKQLAAMEALLFAGTLGTLLLVALSARTGSITLTAASVYIVAALRVSNIGAVGDHDYTIQAGFAGVPKLYELETALSDRAAAPGLKPPDLHQSIRFDQVTFAYPGRTEPVFDGFDFELRVGQSTAIVGANGSGKTTIVKLLARLCEPDAGRIMVDGVDITTYDASAWQQRVAVVFQTYLRLPLTLRENIAPGGNPDADALGQVAARAGLTDFVSRLPMGWDTPMDRQQTGGVDASGGEWQKIALARALYAARGGGVLVLDEPTAALDVRSEARFYSDFLALTAGLTTVVISHRFATVRQARRIVVLEAGMVVEDGSHDELIARDGHYALMYRLQAEAFTRGGEDMTNQSQEDSTTHG